LHSKQTIDKEFLIWFAGFFDGEGCFSIEYYINKKGEKRPRRVDLFIGQSGDKGLKICEEIRSVLGGKIRINSRKEGSWNPCYIWHISNREGVIKIAEAILPYLKVKKEEVKEKLKILHRWRETGRKFWTPEEIALLKKYPHLPATILAKILQRHNYDHVRHKKAKLGLRSNIPPLIANKMFKIAEKNQFKEEILNKLHNIALNHIKQRESA